MYDFLKEETIGLRHQLTFIGDELRIYLPATYLANDSGMASTMGENIETLGLFWFKTNNKFYELTLPIKFTFAYSRKEKYTGKLKPELPEITYDVFVLEKGDAFCYDINHRENVEDIMFFLTKLVEGGKIPQTVSYNDVLKLLLDALVATKSGSLGVSSLTYELLLSELYRSKSNVTVPFRQYINENPGKLYNYKMVKVTKIPELTSVFTGLMGENTNYQIVAAVQHSREGRKEKESPIEKLIKY